MHIPIKAFFQFPLQLGAKFLVISQLTMGFLGVLRRHRIPLATDPQNGTGIRIRSGNNSKSDNGGNKVARTVMAQSNAHLHTHKIDER